MAREWYFEMMGQAIGPLNVAELKEKVSSGQIQSDTMVRKGSEGKWTFAERVKGLISTPAIEDVASNGSSPETKPVVAKTSTTHPTAPMTGSKGVKGERPQATHSSTSGTIGSRVPSPAQSPSTFVVHKDHDHDHKGEKSSQNHPAATPASVVEHIHIRTMHLTGEEDDEETPPPSMEFYDFVGFREAISPVLHDAVKQFAHERGLTMSQVNRRALAEFIERPELASDLLITSVAVIPQPVGHKSNQDGSRSLPEKQQMELSTFRFTLFNTSPQSMQIEQAVFLIESIEERTYDTVERSQHNSLDHAHHIPVRLDPWTNGKSIRVHLDVSVSPDSTHDIVLWFYATNKPTFARIRGQLMVGRGGELAMSEYFTIVLHADSPSMKLQATV